MSDSGRRKPPLVAERRYPSKTAKAKTRAKTKRKTQRRKTRRRNPVTALFAWLLRLVWRLVWGFGWRVAAVSTIIIAVAVGYVTLTLPPVDQLYDGRARGSVTLLDASGDVFAWRGDQFGGVITADTVSPHLKNAIVATEDRRFYRHFGLSPRGIASAVRINLSEGRGPLSGHGGSTITQQTAKLCAWACHTTPSDGPARPTTRPIAARDQSGARPRKPSMPWRLRRNSPRTTS